MASAAERPAAMVDLHRLAGALRFFHCSAVFGFLILFVNHLPGEAG